MSFFYAFSHRCLTRGASSLSSEQLERGYRGSIPIWRVTALYAPIHAHWLDLMHRYGVLEYIDVVTIHAFPGMWFPEHPNWAWHTHWQGWEQKLSYIGQHARGKPI